MHVGEVDLYERNGHTNQSVAQCNRGVRIATRIEQNAVQALVHCQVNSVDERTFPIGLEVAQQDAQALSLVVQTRLDLRQCGGAVCPRLPPTQEVQVGTLKNQQLFRHRIPERR